jgi:serine protease Do
VRVRLTRIDDQDLNLFEFDYDLTLMVFFLNADGQVYARYGGRDAESPDHRQSLTGLHYTMASVLRMHDSAPKLFARRAASAPKFVSEALSMPRFGRCLHCHRVKEILNNDVKKKGQWRPELIWRYPLPESLGFDLEIDRGNVVKNVQDKTPATAAGLRAGDILQLLNGVPVHSFGDAQFALDIAPGNGSIEVVYRRGTAVLKNRLSLPEGWRKTDLTWRPSMQLLVPSAGLNGRDLTEEEKIARGLAANQLAFRQKETVSAQAEAAGIRPGDIILGVDDKPFLDMDVYDFLRYVQHHYLVGDRLTVQILRDDQRRNVNMTLRK